MSGVKIQDVAAGVCAVLITGGVIALLMLERQIGGEIWTLAGAAYGWLFTRGAVNGVKQLNGNGAPESAERRLP